jgi:hypothetical protein
MPTGEQIKLIQTAARAAGLRNGKQEDRYRMVLAQYRVKSCKDMTNAQIDDFLAICEALGWRYPGKSETYCRDRAKAAADGRYASYSQIEAISHLAGDLGFTPVGNSCLAKFIDRMTAGRVDTKEQLTRDEAYCVIEAMKAMLQRRDGIKYKDCKQIKTNYTEVPEHGKEAVESCPF